MLYILPAISACVRTGNSNMTNNPATLARISESRSFHYNHQQACDNGP